jgi:cell division protein FtsX
MTTVSEAAIKSAAAARSLTLLLGLVWLLAAAGRVEAALPVDPVPGFRAHIEALAALGDRSSGTEGQRRAAAYIRDHFTRLGIADVGSQRFRLPVRQHRGSFLSLPDLGLRLPVQPLWLNALAPETVAPEDLRGPLVYAGAGDLTQLAGRQIEGAILLVEMEVGRQWVQLANLGARALVVIDRGQGRRGLFQSQFELTPVRLPRLWIPAADLAAHLGEVAQAPGGLVAREARLTADAAWEEAEGENVYALIPGADPELERQLLVVEAFYDSTAWVAGRAPGADEACSIATLLQLAEDLQRRPPGRSVLLLATSGHAQALAGMREAVWSVHTRSKEMILARKRLSDRIKDSRRISEDLSLAALATDAPDPLLVEALRDQIKTLTDQLARQLTRLRLDEPAAAAATIRNLADRRMLLRHLGWRERFTDLSPAERQALEGLVPPARARHRAVLADAKRQLAHLQQAAGFRSLVREREVAAVVSLHLSSHGDGLGAFNDGWLFALRPTINRVAAYSRLDEVLRQAAAAIESAHGLEGLFQDTLRPSRRRTWQSYFLDRPPLGGEISALAGYHGLTLATTHDARDRWGTPGDTPEHLDYAYAARQSFLAGRLMEALSRAPRLHDGQFPQNGFSVVSGRAKFLRQGELFADQPAPGTVILAFQGPGRFHALVDQAGGFELRGVADKKHVYDKVILEGYRFDPQSGAALWAIDKPGTGKHAYRVKMDRENMETDLIMFACRESTLFNLLEPRTFRPMTKLQLIDGRREASPLRYWYSRIDTRESVLCSVYLEPGSRLKLTLSDTVLRRKMILTGSDPEHPEGLGYRVDDWPLLHHTEYRTAQDMWALLAPRIDSLEAHGIHDKRLRDLQREGQANLETARRSLESRAYHDYLPAAARSWALASRVYDQVEKTQRDVLFGVLFYIALFVPFAFCLERLLFAYRNIHKRIVAFTLILAALIALIYQVHPAFELAYSPTVVILAFFIMGLSLIVTLIIFFRFEEEMAQLQKRALDRGTPDISRWKAFVAAFFLGVGNLRRRRLRTILTCTTLIILTFTIMSFTAVKSSRHQTRIRFQEASPYRGLLLKNANWQSLPAEALPALKHAAGGGDIGPRVWLETGDRTRSPAVPVRRGGRTFTATGVVGLSAAEARLTGLDQSLTGGGWFTDDHERAVILPERMAETLGLDPRQPDGARVELWGVPFRVAGVFAPERFQAMPDLDGEPLTPVIFPSESAVALTDIEMEALESGDDVRSYQSRYQHVPADLVVLMPYAELLRHGGELKAVTLTPEPTADMPATALNLVDRFGLMLFSGESEGTFVYNSTDTIQYSGLPNVVIPMAIAVFIVLNTMIGSVYERKREIAIYTSVGLAPTHVAFLFIAESMAFAVLSVVLGYLLAQTSARFLVHTTLWAGITVNYSSLAGIAAMLLVMLVVLISVLYPARVAAQIAIPDVNRSWRLPDPKQNRMDITLPFLIKHRERLSAAGFLLEYLAGHQDVSHGLFATDDIVLETAPAEASGPSLRLAARVWLAPFDFGIMQRVAIGFHPTAENPDFLEIRLGLTREAGEANAWGRINRAFVNDLRKQLLVWRSLDADHMLRFAAKLDTLTGGRPWRAATPLSDDATAAA